MSNLPPILIYASEESVRQEILAQLTAFSRTESLPLRILLNSRNEREARRCIQEADSLLLLILGVSRSASLSVPATLERQSSEKSRDNYTVYWLQDREALADVVSESLHPSGIVISPDSFEHFVKVLRRIAEDYGKLEGVSDQRFLTLRSGGNIYRVAVNSISYIEANDRKILIWTKRQCLTVYEKLDNLEKKLGEGFIRCHRSYLVNRNQIEHAHFSEMEVILTDGIRLPVSRSGRDALKRGMLAGEE